LPGRAPGPVQISVDLWGGLDLAGAAPDHSVQILLNGQVLASERFDGLTAKTITLSAPDSSLLANNTLTIRVPGDTGYAADVVLLDGFSVHYPRTSTLAGDAWRIGEFSASTGADTLFAASFEVRSGFALSGVVANTALWSQIGTQLYRDVVSQNAALNNQVSALRAATEAQLLAPMLRAAPQAAPASLGTADYLIITHPQFEADLAPLIALQQSRGYQVKVLSTEALYARSSDHERSPQALREAISQVNPRFVLLLGGDSYDYDNNLNLGSVSFLPTFYRGSDPIVRFAVSDAPYVDANNDGVPERALGRIPARTNIEAQRAIAAIVARAQSPATRYFASAGLSSPTERFGPHARSLLSYLRQGQPKSFGLVDEVGLVQARSRASAALAGSADWVSYIGHSSPNRWAFQNLLDTSQLAGVNRTGLPAIVLQWGCWNSYFALPNQDTMSHALMLRSNTLAAAVIGSSSLAEDASHMALGTRFFDLVEDGRLTHHVGGNQAGTPINTLGEALQAAKANLANTAPEHIESNYSITLFGDPAQPMR